MVIKRVKKSSDKSNYTIRLDSTKISLPLKVRTREFGDKIEIKNLGGHKKVKDILIDEKIPVEKRNNIPVVTDSKNTILWLPGLKKSKFDMETDQIYDIILLYKR